MIRIEDMSEMERQSWVTLMADTAVFAYFLKKMTNQFEVVSLSPKALLETYLAVIVITIIIHVVISSLFAARLRGETTEIDERDREIETRGDRNGFWVVCIAVNVIIFTLLFEYAYPNPKNYDPPFSVIAPPHMFFALMATMFVADIVKRASMIWEYRGWE